MSMNYVVMNSPSFDWPDGMTIPTKRFRLLIAADARKVSTEAISAFATAAMNAGMVYCCVWGPDCERVHDIIDEVEVEDDIGIRRYAGPNPNDVIMTTWHSDESLADAVEFFTLCAIPSEGFLEDSEFWLAISVANPEWQGAIENALALASRQGRNENSPAL